MTDTCEVTYEKRISRMFTSARVFAILTVISAHITIKNSTFIANFYSAIGSIGVIVFFIAAGYYFKKEAPFTFIKKKAKTVLLPWVVLGSVVYVVNSLLSKNGLGIVSYVEWMLGYKTYLYFVIVLVACFVLFYYHNLITLTSAVVINALSLIMTYLGVLDPVIENLHITNYLNLFNWIGFFAIGILLKKVSTPKLFSFFKRTRYIALILSVICVAVVTFSGYKIGYFSAFGWMFELLCTWSILGVCTFEITHNRFFASISTMSYSIYLLHMMFVGILAKIYSIHPIVSLFANIIVLMFTYFILWVGKLLAKPMKISKIYCSLVGIRPNR